MFRAASLNRISSLALLVFTVFIYSIHSINAQSQALNGQIEGVVTDTTGAAVPSASLKIKNIETGAERQVITDGEGVYRAPLLPLGTYRVTVEAPNFK
ncbi:MAG: carboxypeptidase-like regulatory domain-containing protein, partial [Pyrinomonadaceae bacterium]